MARYVKWVGTVLAGHAQETLGGKKLFYLFSILRATREILFHIDKWNKRINFGIMKIVTLNIPENVDVNSADLAMIVASRLYEQGKLSLGQAAEIVGLTKRAFTELLGKFNVSIFNYPESDLPSDVANA